MQGFGCTPDMPLVRHDLDNMEKALMESEQLNLSRTVDEKVAALCRKRRLECQPQHLCYPCQIGAWQADSACKLECVSVTVVGGTFYEGFHLFLEPVHILLQELHAVEQACIRRTWRIYR